MLIKVEEKEKKRVPIITIMGKRISYYLRTKLYENVQREGNEKIKELKASLVNLFIDEIVLGIKDNFSKNKEDGFVPIYNLEIDFTGKIILIFSDEDISFKRESFVLQEPIYCKKEFLGKKDPGKMVYVSDNKITVKANNCESVFISKGIYNGYLQILQMLAREVNLFNKDLINTYGDHWQFLEKYFNKNYITYKDLYNFNEDWFWICMEVDGQSEDVICGRYHQPYYVSWNGEIIG